MKITESKLRQIILEEIQVIELEELLQEMYLQKFAEHGVPVDLVEGRDWFPIATTGIAIGALGALMSFQNAQNAEQAAAAQAAMDQATTKLASLDHKTDTMRKQLTNMHAWTWTDDADPRSREMFPMIEFDNEDLEGVKFTVMPPEYSVFLQVLEDKEAGIMRYGMPDSMEDVKELNADIKTSAQNIENSRAASQNRIDFTNQFDEPALYDTTSSEVGVYGVGGQIYQNADGKLVQARAVMPDFEDLESYYGGPLPLSGLSLEDTYNSFMFGSYLSAEEMEKISQAVDK